MAEYGVPIYLTINASNNKDVIMDVIGKAIEEAVEYNCPLYITVNAGSPTQPPPKPPGGGQ